jgi:four helix bundle protein
MESRKTSERWTKTFMDLIVWQKATELVTEIYKFSASFPRMELLGLSAQLRRASVSIPSNIAEGYGRKSKSDFVRFCQISMGSLFEVQTQVTIAKNLGYLTVPVHNELIDDLKEIERLLSSFIESLNRQKVMK